MFSGQRDRNSVFTAGSFGWLFCVNPDNQIEFVTLIYMYCSLLFDTLLYLPFAFRLDIKCTNHIEIFFAHQKKISHILALPNEIIETKK